MPVDPHIENEVVRHAETDISPVEFDDALLDRFRHGRRILARDFERDLLANIIVPTKLRIMAEVDHRPGLALVDETVENVIDPCAFVKVTSAAYGTNLIG
jgi:hypothetical protein